jgi:hypothetical protein
MLETITYGCYRGRETTNEHLLEINSMLVVSLRRQKDSTGQIVQIEINFPSEPKQQHKSSNRN